MVGNGSPETWQRLRRIIQGWGCFFDVTDGYAVAFQFIEQIGHIVSQPFMPRKEGESTRLRHDLARLESKNVMQNCSAIFNIFCSY